MTGSMSGEAGGVTVTLKPLLQIATREWARFHSFFRDREIAEWNGSGPLRMPLWLFKRVVIGEENAGERRGFAILTEDGTFIGSVELYDLAPSKPHQPQEATLGIIIGDKGYWGRGYGTAAVRAAVRVGFETLRLRSISLSTLSHNARARRAFEKAEFHLDGYRGNGVKRDALYSLTREEWLALSPP